MIKLGNALFRYRNFLGPLVFLVALTVSRPQRPFDSAELRLGLEIAGILVALAGECLRILAIGFEYIVRGGRDRRVYADRLVEGGMFAACRNPLYAGNILIAVGLALVVNAYAFYLIVIPTLLVAYQAIVLAEEAYLRGKFGAAYGEYCSRVNRWWPRLTGELRPAGSVARFNWGRVIVKEYNTILLLVGVLPALHYWGEYRIGGAQSLPSVLALGCAAALWVVLYLTVRALKRRGYISDQPRGAAT